MLNSLFENIERLGNSIDAAIKNLAKEMLGRELDDEQVAEIVDELKLSDLLVLDTAYNNGDKDKVAQMLGLSELSEYSMGRNATSAAASRPKPGRREAPQAANDQPASGNTTQTNRNYSGGASNKTAPAPVAGNSSQTQDQEQGEEELEENVVDMVEWLQRKAGIK